MGYASAISPLRVLEVGQDQFIERVLGLETQLQAYLALGEPRDWESTQRLELPDLKAIIDERIANRVYQVQSHRITSIASPYSSLRPEMKPNLRPTTLRLRAAIAEKGKTPKSQTTTAGSEEPGSSQRRRRTSSPNPETSSHKSGT